MTVTGFERKLLAALALSLVLLAGTALVLHLKQSVRVHVVHPQAADAR